MPMQGSYVALDTYMTKMLHPTQYLAIVIMNKQSTATSLQFHCLNMVKSLRYYPWF